MDNSFKRILNFDASLDIEEVIEKWAKDNGFEEEEYNPISNFNDVTYAYSLKTDSAKSHVLISILDNKVLIESYAIQDISKNELSQSAIEKLLNTLEI